MRLFFVSFHSKRIIMGQDTKSLLQIGDKIIAQEIQCMLEEENVYSLLRSDNPASSFLNTYMGTGTIENVEVVVNKDDYNKASEIIKNSAYADLLM